MDDVLFGLGILLALLVAVASPIIALFGLIFAIRARREVQHLQLRLNRLESEMRPAQRPSDDLAAEEAAFTEVEVAEPVEATPPESEASKPTSVPPIPAAAAQPVPPRQGFEEKLGSRWAVWVGGVALALGGIFLVRYSIEQNLLTPQTRIILGILFALALIGAGEWMRRRESRFGLLGIPSANIPSILTAAGTCTAFASAYAAYALYGLIGPGMTFVLLGLIAILAMIASTLHGPALAALGLLGAMGSPFLVSSDRPQPWALVIYLAFVVLPAFGVARLRLWRWLALAASTGALPWTAPIFFIDGSNVLPAMAHLALQAGLAAFFLAVDPYRHVADDEARIDKAASVVLFAFAFAGIVVASSVYTGGGRPVFVTAMALILLGAGLRIANVSTAAASSAALAAGTLLAWPLASDIGDAPESLFFQSGDAFALRPYALNTYLALAALLPLLIAGASLLRLARSRGLNISVAAWYAAAASAGPLLALIAAYWRVTEFERSLSFAIVAGIVALAFVLASQWLMRLRTTDEDPAIRLGLGATASAALGALALGLTFALEKGMLTVAFALAALGTAWVAHRIAIPALRYAVGVIGLTVLGRLIWDPTIVGGDPGPVIFNWLLWGYGIPAISFWWASRLLERSGRDRTVQLTESLAIVFAAFLVFFEIRHALHAGNPLAADFSLLEAGLFATQSLVFAIVLTRMDFRRADPVYRWGSLIFKVASFGVCAIGLIVIENPLLTNDRVTGGMIFNSLIPAYLLPSILAGILAYVERGVRPPYFALASGILSLVLQWAYVALEIRRIFQGPNLGFFWRGFAQGEQWSYSVALLVIGIALLGYGLLRDSRFARIASAVYLVLAVMKVFIVDLSNLEGVMRALSFIGLGLVLIGIGLVYQRFLVRRPGNAAIS
ncbi:DUF2339 domain-containing protein [Microvirga guangxiensis]|uniref:Uncharacterized membrane protein n=1 Tax=Microvirga guangxiensis TaxID=549386 RepID=A0A1G5JPL7_9HYPH|nr:DUF2339 domain-containing protein [Microvirga guangxiensis]SCY90277.1 Uncharacterized membrane protein [Microvirga guangxiensis]